MTHSKNISDYLAEKKPLWSKSSHKAACSRLKWEALQDPQAIYEAMVKERRRPYYIKITFVNLASFLDWAIENGREQGPNKYRRFLDKNNQLFRNAYEDKYTTLTWEEFKAEYRQASGEMRSVLALLAFGGCRLAEVPTFDGTTVLGKGSKRRPIHLPSGVVYPRVSLSAGQIRRRLRSNPHSYRKLAADKWLRSGVDLKTVQVLLGHTSLVSTQRYLRPLEQEETKRKLEAMWRTA